MDTPPPPGLRFSLLGSFEVRDQHGPVDIGPHKQRLLLATLLCRANTVVSVDQLTEAVWDDAPPRTSRKNLQAYVSTLRKIVGDRISHTGYGYLLRCTADELDVLRFEEAVARGRTAVRDGAVDLAAAALAEALAQWRGPFLSDVPCGPVLGAEAVRLTDRRLRAFEDWADAAGRLGEHRDVLDMVDAVADAHPERERLTIAKLTALYQCGRRQEALAYYEFVRVSLARDLGLDPSPALRELLRAMLAGDPVTTGPVAAGSPSRGRSPARSPSSRSPSDGPADRAPLGDPLPAGTPDFTGREREIGCLVAAFGPESDDTGTTVVTGPVGVGKTALAVHVARLAAAGFPDGQLLVPMRDEHRRPRTVADLLTGIALVLGLDVDGRGADAAAAWRAWLSRHRVLIVLDDARDESVVRALLPGRGPSRILVTSRFRLSGLGGVRHVELGELAAREAVELTAKIAGLHAVLDDREGIARHIAHCGRSPLAVRILAGRMRSFPGPPVRAGRDLLDQLVLGDLSLADRYREHCADLRETELRVLAALATAAGPPFDRGAIGVLAAGDREDVDRAIESLVEANLLVRPDDEVNAHADWYDMPTPAYQYARSRLAGHTA